MANIHEPVVAGAFYPGDSAVLKSTVEALLAVGSENLPIPKAIIAPHAGYVYSGSIAASAFACLAKVKDQIDRVILFGPSHRYPVQGLAVHSADFFSTPLGEIPIDRKSLDRILQLPQVMQIDEAFAQEHSLEVELPFLQCILNKFQLVPIVVGMATDAQVAEVMEMLWDGPSTLIVISTDLSHYQSYAVARQLDQLTANAIVALQTESVSNELACGGTAVRGLLEVAKKKALTAKIIDLRNSGDTSGKMDQVVGYGAFHFI